LNRALEYPRAFKADVYPSLLTVVEEASVAGGPLLLEVLGGNIA